MSLRMGKHLSSASMDNQNAFNGGTTWTHTNLNWTVSQNRTIRRLVMHPTNAKILLAATSAGLYRTVNGGATWTQILPASTYDVEFQQNNGAIVYATTNQVLKSTNGGASFSPLTASCTGSRYNIEIARSNPQVLYTLCTNGTVQKSTDAGATWAVVTAPGVTLYGYYDNVLAVSPVSENIVYVAGFNMKRLTDGVLLGMVCLLAGTWIITCSNLLPAPAVSSFQAMMAGCSNPPTAVPPGPVSTRGSRSRSSTALASAEPIPTS